MLFVTRRLTFSAAHRLFNPNFSDEKNEEIFDKCNNVNGHGHNYILDVTVSGTPDPETGYVVDLKRLKDLVNDELVQYVDHKHLNYDVDFLKGIIPTVENLAVVFWEILAPKISQGQLHKLTLFESETSWAEYYGEPVEIKKW